MLYLTLQCRLTLLLVVTVAMLLNKRVAGRLQSTVEEKEFQTRDIILLVVFMAIIISAIAYTSIINPGAMFQNLLLVFFLSSYTVLLFTFSYVFSNVPKIRAQLLSVGFGVASLVAGVRLFVRSTSRCIYNLQGHSVFGSSRLLLWCYRLCTDKRYPSKSGGM